MAKKIVIELSQSGIKKAIDELNAYKQSLRTKGEIFVKRLGEIGIPVIDSKINEAQGDSNKSHYTHIKIQHFKD